MTCQVTSFRDVSSSIFIRCIGKMSLEMSHDQNSFLFCEKCRSPSSLFQNSQEVMAHMNKAVAAAAELSKWAGICQQAMAESVHPTVRFDGAWKTTVVAQLIPIN